MVFCDEDKVLRASNF